MQSLVAPPSQPSGWPASPVLSRTRKHNKVRLRACVHAEPGGNVAPSPAASLPSGLTKNQRKKLKKKQKKAAAKGSSPSGSQATQGASAQDSEQGVGSAQNGDHADSAAAQCGDSFDGR